MKRRIWLVNAFLLLAAVLLGVHLLRKPAAVEGDADSPDPEAAAAETFRPRPAEIPPVPAARELVDKNLFRESREPPPPLPEPEKVEVAEPEAPKAVERPKIEVGALYAGPEARSAVLAGEGKLRNAQLLLREGDFVVEDPEENQIFLREIKKILNGWELHEVWRGGVTLRHRASGQIETYEKPTLDTSLYLSRRRDPPTEAAETAVTDGGAPASPPKPPARNQAKAPAASAERIQPKPKAPQPAQTARNPFTQKARDAKPAANSPFAKLQKQGDAGDRAGNDNQAANPFLEAIARAKERRKEQETGGTPGAPTPDPAPNKANPSNPFLDAMRRNQQNHTAAPEGNTGGQNINPFTGKPMPPKGRPGGSANPFAPASGNNNRPAVNPFQKLIDQQRQKQQQTQTPKPPANAGAANPFAPQPSKTDETSESSSSRPFENNSGRKPFE